MVTHSDKHNPAAADRNIILDIDQLKQSHPVAKEINRPKPLWEILEEIYDVLKENNIAFEQGKIYTTAGSAKNINTGEQGEAAGFTVDKLKSPGEWVFDDIFTRIVITDALNELEGAIQIAYNPYGMQVAFGLSYEDRSKFVHLGEEEAIMSTYACGDVKVLAYFVMIHKVRQWFPFSNNNVIEQLERAKALMNKTLNKEFILKFIDNYYQYTLKYNDCLEDGTLLRMDEFEYFTENLKKDADSQFSGQAKISAWDMLSLGTAILSPEKPIPLRAIIPLGFMWGGYCFSRLI